MKLILALSSVDFGAFLKWNQIYILQIPTATIINLHMFLNNKQYQPVFTIVNTSVSFVRKFQSTTPDFWGENMKNASYCAAFDKLCMLLGWFSNRTGTSVDDGKARGKD